MRQVAPCSRGLTGDGPVRASIPLAAPIFNHLKTNNNNPRLSYLENETQKGSRPQPNKEERTGDFWRGSSVTGNFLPATLAASFYQ